MKIQRKMNIDTSKHNECDCNHITVQKRQIKKKTKTPNIYTSFYTLYQLDL